MTIRGQKEIDLCVRKKYFLDYETNKAGNFYLAGYHSNGNFQQVILDERLKGVAQNQNLESMSAEEFTVGQEFRSRAVFDNADFSTGYRRGRGVFVAFATGQCESSGGSAKQDGGEFHVHGIGVFNVCLLLELQLACQLRSDALQIWPILRLLVQGFD